MINKKRYFLLMLIVAGLFLLDFIAYTVLEFFGVFRGLNIFVPYAMVCSMIALMGLLFYYLLRYVNARMVTNNLMSQNLHAFGKSTIFFNRLIFEDVVNAMRKRVRYHDSTQYLIIFSGVSNSVSYNSSRQETIREFQNLTVNFLDSYFKQNDTKEKRHLFCYDEGVFMIYCFNDSKMDVIHLVNVIDDRLYQLANENNIHLLVTPYFGITDVRPKEILLEAIENANLSRKISEKNFELLNFYQSSLRQNATKDDARQLLDALENKEFVVYYQPKFDLGRNCFISAEALIRWNSQTRGLLLPSAFVDQANAAGLNNDLDMYVFERVCEDLQENKKRGRRILPVSLNFSLYEFYSPNFLTTITDILKKYDVNPHLIQIEILETTSQANPFLSVSIIKKLREIGVKVLMDDFGMGYSNIGNLFKIPFDTIKIDRSYVQNIVTDKKARQICQCMVDLGKINNLEVIAEGVDDEKQVEVLRNMGCDTIQGFYYSKPLERSAYEKFLVDNPFEKEERHP